LAVKTASEMIYTSIVLGGALNSAAILTLMINVSKT